MQLWLLRAGVCLSVKSRYKCGSRTKLTDSNARNRGKDFVFWAVTLGRGEQFADQLPSPSARCPGLYFLGMNFLYNRKSGILLGVGEDAAHIAAAIAERG
jgi:hypothetical protein